jgi:hypothetical protein
MLSEPRTISIIAELVHLPVKQAFERLRDVYAAVSTPCGYDNCIRLPSGARLERGAGETEEVSTLTFLPDRVQMVEDNLATSVDGVGRKLIAVLEKAMPALGIPVILAQQFTVRAIAAPNSFKTASEFIGRSLFRIENEDVQVLERPTNIFGLRLVFPPTATQPWNFNVRIEAYTRDPKSVYLENTGMFKAPVEYGRLDALQQNLETTSDFLSGKICRFLSQYDRRREQL